MGFDPAVSHYAQTHPCGIAGYLYAQIATPVIPQLKLGKHAISRAAHKAFILLDLNGAQGRNRTTDTRIFNPLLYP